MDKWKAKAAAAGSSLNDKRHLHSGPSSKYTPARPFETALADPAALQSNSAALRTHNTVTIVRPLPPPRRNMTTDSASSNESAPAPPLFAPAPPARKYGAPPPTSPSPDLPFRGGSPSARQTPAPPYQHAYANDLPAPVSAQPSRLPPTRGGVGAVPAVKLFSQYGPEDKKEFFEMLDEYFSSRLKAGDSSVQNNPMIPHATTKSTHISQPSPVSPPQSDSRSYPPRQTHSSSALSILHYILYATYDSPWFTSPSPYPPPLEGRTEIRSATGWSQSGDQKALTGCALFGDASIAWWRLSWSASEEARGRLDTNSVKREGRYRPIPEAWDGDRLYNCNEMYGEALVNFAENAVASRKPVARGECWDVAAEGIDSIATGRQDLPKPFPSIGRTHGHLIYYGNAEGGQNRGEWRGGDPYVREGDIVEWRSVTIREVGMQAGAFMKLGAPEHTAIIVAAGTSQSTPSNGQSHPISALESLTVVEQSQGALPITRTYDMSAMSAGEIWIYRPVPLVEYVGSEVTPAWPPACETWEVGQLD